MTYYAIFLFQGSPHWNTSPTPSRAWLAWFLWDSYQNLNLLLLPHKSKRFLRTFVICVITAVSSDMLLLRGVQKTLFSSGHLLHRALTIFPDALFQWFQSLGIRRSDINVPLMYWVLHNSFILYILTNWVSMPIFNSSK